MSRLRAAAGELRSLLVRKVGRKIVAVGRNYAEHAAEMGDVARAATKSTGPPGPLPLLFLKPTTSYVSPPGPILVPRGMELSHEVELGVVLAKQLSSADIDMNAPRKVMDAVAGYVCAIDVTARNVQASAKKQGHPWTLSKSCDTFTPVSYIIPRKTLSDDRLLGPELLVSPEARHSSSENRALQDENHGVTLFLEVNGELRQEDNTRNMLCDIPTVLSYISSYITLEEGDVVLTGTPSGVGPLVAGDVVTAGIRELKTEIKFNVAARQLTPWELTAEHEHRRHEW
mmetsp:Transcript_8153/g.17568  ORF Transcript_8153/g.17568 Transcript_8153/m.17568 type:complete len:286 (+) Transcript_8153:145-1002(+)